MKAIIISETGSSSQMKCEEVPIPEPGQNEVRLRRLARDLLSHCESIEIWKLSLAASLYINTCWFIDTKAFGVLDYLQTTFTSHQIIL